MSDDIPSGVFRFLPVERVEFGPGAVRGLGRALDHHRLQRALVITGATIAAGTNLLWYIEQILGPRHAASYSGARQHVPSTSVEEAAELARIAGADCLVSLGGGSPIDTAKAVAHRLAHPEAAPAEGADAKAGPGETAPLPHFAVPTTLSAGEFTHLAGVTDEQTRVKGGVAEPALTPRAVFLDPEMTVPTPRDLWLSTGIKALDHAVERFCSPGYHPITDLLAREAVRLLFAYLPRTAADPDDLDARMQCQIAAWMSLFSDTGVRTGLSHALGHQIGARCGVPHGVTSCITLPHVMRFIAPAAAHRLAALATAMDIAHGDDESADAAAAAEAVAALVTRLGLTARLRDAGVPQSELPAIAQAAWEEAGTHQGPRPAASLDELTGLLQSMW